MEMMALLLLIRILASANAALSRSAVHKEFLFNIYLKFITPYDDVDVIGAGDFRLILFEFNEGIFFMLHFICASEGCEVLLGHVA